MTFPQNVGQVRVVFLGMNRIKLYESAIKDLHEVKMKQVQATVSGMIIESAIVIGISVTVVTLTVLTPSLVQAFLNVF